MARLLDQAFSRAVCLRNTVKFLYPNFIGVSKLSKNSFQQVTVATHSYRQKARRKKTTSSISI